MKSYKVYKAEIISARNWYSEKWVGSVVDITEDGTLRSDMDLPFVRKLDPRDYIILINTNRKCYHLEF